MIRLPIDDFLPEISGHLCAARSVVIVAEPGAGKTTRVPPAILRAGFLSQQHPNVVMLQPRRVAARASAARIAEENGWELGREVGYQIRFEKRMTSATRLRVLTEGILTRQLLDDPFLEGTGVVILDEFHERSLHSDLAVAMLRELQQTVRDDLRLVIMSATLDAQAAAKFMGDCPIVSVPGRIFPVTIEHQGLRGAGVVEAVAAAAEDQVRSQPNSSTSDILVFLPGAEEIRRTMRLLEPLASQYNLDLLPLYGSLPFGQQALALRPSSRQKVILATNIAETSLTIDGVTTIIDSGLARVPMFDPQRGLDQLELKRISKASAKQRAGRAGRTAPGKCIRLWTAKEQEDLQEFELPEISRVDLCSAVLDVHAWGKTDARDFGWYQPPPERAIVAAEELLRMLGALNGKQLTLLGRQLMKLPVHPRLGRLICAAADAGCPDQGATLAALLAEKDIWLDDFQSHPRDRKPSVQAESDVLIRMDALELAERERFAAHLRDQRIDPVAARQAAAARDQLQRLAQQLGSQSKMPPDTQTLLKLILLAYPDRVCRRRAGNTSAGAMTGGGGVRLAADSVVQQGEFFIAVDARNDPRNPRAEALVRIASMVDVRWLSELFPQSVTRLREALFDADAQRVVGIDVVRYRDLILSEARNTAPDRQQAARVLAAALRPRTMEIFRDDPAAAAILARAALLRQWMPEHPWPKWDAEDLAETLENLCAGKTSAADVRRGLARGLEDQLIYPLDRLLAEHAPEAIEVPSGSRIKLEYTMSLSTELGTSQAPVLAVRLQEIFGWTQTPRVAGGRLPVLLHLLGPNYRAVQITDDLNSFWSTAYFQVRKDLRVRYPKHSWPEDPLTAQAVAKGGRKRA